MFLFSSPSGALCLFNVDADKWMFVICGNITVTTAYVIDFIDFRYSLFILYLVFNREYLSYNSAEWPYLAKVFLLLGYQFLKVKGFVM